VNQPLPAPPRDKTSDQRAARRNYIVFCGVTGLVLFVVVLVGSLFAAP
jgi:hypothetical protein